MRKQQAGHEPCVAVMPLLLLLLSVVSHMQAWTCRGIRNAHYNVPRVLSPLGDDLQPWVHRVVTCTSVSINLLLLLGLPLLLPEEGDPVPAGCTA